MEKITNIAIIVFAFYCLVIQIDYHTKTKRNAEARRVQNISSEISNIPYQIHKSKVFTLSTPLTVYKDSTYYIDIVSGDIYTFKTD